MFKGLIDLIQTILAVIELSEGGFRITKYHNELMGTDMYRFWWKKNMLPQHGDITHLGEGAWSTMLNGSSWRLDRLKDLDFHMMNKYNRVEKVERPEEESIMTDDDIDRLR